MWWPFSNTEPVPCSEEKSSDVHRLHVNRSMPVENGEPYLIQIGLTQIGDTERFRVFYMVNKTKIYPRQVPMSLTKALRIVNVWDMAFQVTYDVGLEQKVCDL